MTKQQQIKRRLAVIGGAVIILTIISTVFGLAWPILESKAGPTLPPRKPPTSVPSDSDDDDDDGGKPLGAYIELQVQSARSGMWAAVEWQDSSGGWHKVDGWSGALNGSSARWWVHEKDFGKESFRWVVTEGTGGPLLGSSEPFNLPQRANETVQVIVSVGS